MGAEPVSTVVVFRLDHDRCALPLQAVETVVRSAAWSPLPEAPAIALGVVNLHGAVIPVLDLRSRLGRPRREPQVNDHLLIARAGVRTVALPVDEVTGPTQVPESQLVRTDSILASIPHLRGIVALADGLLFIHDLSAFLSLEEHRRLDGALDGWAG